MNSKPALSGAYKPMRKVSAKTQAKVSAAILEIQSQAEASLRARGFTCPAADTCTTCGHPAAAPHRRLQNGYIIEGCVDAAHSRGYLQGASLAWHMAPSAHALRARTLAHLKTL